MHDHQGICECYSDVPLFPHLGYISIPHPLEQRYVIDLGAYIGKKSKHKKFTTSARIEMNLHNGGRKEVFGLKKGVERLSETIRNRRKIRFVKK